MVSNQWRGVSMARVGKTNRVPKTRAGGTWTEAAFWGFIRSGIRRLSTSWPPISKVKLQYRRPYSGPNARQKWEYQCALCGEWFPEAVTVGGKRQSIIHIDHIVPCGELSSWDELRVFAERLFVEEDGLRVTCKDCNQARKREVAEKMKGASCSF